MRRRIKWQDKTFQVDLWSREPLEVEITEGEKSWRYKMDNGLGRGQGRFRLTDGTFVPYFVSSSAHGYWVTLAGETYFFEKAKTLAGAEENHAGFVAPMPGKIVQVAVGPGDEVDAGEVLIILEAMKMEHRIDAPCSGTVSAIHVSENQLVDQGFSLLDFEAKE